MDETFNAVNDAQELNVEAQNPVADEGATAVEQSPSAEGLQQPPQEPAKPAQTAEDNTKFKEIRQLAEQKAAELTKQRVDNFYKTTYAGQVNPYNGNPIDSEAAYKEFEQQSALHQMAEKNGVSVQEQENLLKKVIQTMPEYQQLSEQAKKAQQDAETLREELNKITFDKDLSEVKKINPKETADSIEKLGKVFMIGRAQGLSVQEAYELSLASAKRNNPAPPSMGDINNGGADESEFYTLEQLQKLSPEEMNKSWEKVQKSRSHIFK